MNEKIQMDSVFGPTGVGGREITVHDGFLFPSLSLCCVLPLSENSRHLMTEERIRRHILRVAKDEH